MWSHPKCSNVPCGGWQPLFMFTSLEFSQWKWASCSHVPLTRCRWFPHVHHLADPLPLGCHVLPCAASSCFLLCLWSVFLVLWAFSKAATPARLNSHTVALNTTWNQGWQGFVVVTTAWRMTSLWFGTICTALWVCNILCWNDWCDQHPRIRPDMPVKELDDDDVINILHCTTAGAIHGIINALRSLWHGSIIVTGTHRNTYTNFWTVRWRGIDIFFKLLQIFLTSVALEANFDLWIITRTVRQFCGSHSLNYLSVAAFCSKISHDSHHFGWSLQLSCENWQIPLLLNIPNGLYLQPWSTTHKMAMSQTLLRRQYQKEETGLYKIAAFNQLIQLILALLQCSDGLPVGWRMELWTYSTATANVKETMIF